MATKHHVYYLFVLLSNRDYFLSSVTGHIFRRAIGFDRQTAQVRRRFCCFVFYDNSNTNSRLSTRCVFYKFNFFFFTTITPKKIFQLSHSYWYQYRQVQNVRCSQDASAVLELLSVK